MRGYIINEIFYSLQGEGVRAGTPNFFLRLSRCNLACKVETHGFDCDTEFESGRWMTAEEIARAVGVSRSSVSLWVRDIELSAEQVDALRSRNPILNGQLAGARSRSSRRSRPRVTTASNPPA